MGFRCLLRWPERPSKFIDVQAVQELDQKGYDNVFVSTRASSEAVNYQS